MVIYESLIRTVGWASGNSRESVKLIVDVRNDGRITVTIGDDTFFLGNCIFRLGLYLRSGGRVQSSYTNKEVYLTAIEMILLYAEQSGKQLSDRVRRSLQSDIDYLETTELDIPKVFDDVTVKEYRLRRRIVEQARESGRFVSCEV